MVVHRKLVDVRRGHRKFVGVRRGQNFKEFGLSMNIQGDSAVNGSV
jgi:hypothetical protein